MTFGATQISWLWFDGAWYDIGGAILLARGFLAVTPVRLIAQSSSGWGGFSAPLLRMFCEQKFDAQVAGALLAVGFTMQAMAALGINTDGLQIAVVLLTPLVLALVGYFWLRPWVTRRYVRNALRTTPHLDGPKLLEAAFKDPQATDH